MSERSWASPPNPYTNPDFPAEFRAWDKGLKAGIEAAIERLETLMGTAVINRGTTFRFLYHEMWQQLRKEAGLD